MENLFDIPIFYIFSYTLIFLFLSILLVKSKKRFLLPAFLSFLFLGALTFKNYNLIPKNHIRNIVSCSAGLPKKILLKGNILNKPSLRKVGYYRVRNCKFLLSLKAIRTDNGWKDSSGIVMVNAFNPSADFKYADEVILEGALALPRPATNPGQFDYAKFLERKKIFYILNVTEKDFLKITGRGGGKSNKINRLLCQPTNRDGNK
ncbi:MAG: DUF4131 domain-containing protein [Candidatus Omnitrophica bacterium]|nr:DUF4131 domain-containing protein [Candidatus Omnitrophota bacterium]